MKDVAPQTTENNETLNNINNKEIMRQNENSALAVKDVAPQASSKSNKVAMIEGVETNIILAKTPYSMELPKDKSNIIGLLDKNSLLDCLFHLATPEIFWNEHVELKDLDGHVIEAGTDNVYVICDTADSYWRYAVEGVLKHVQVHNFNSVQEYAKTIGSTMLYSRGLSNVEKIGVAALATGNEAYMTVFDFAKEHKVPMNTAQAFLGMKMVSVETLIMTTGQCPKITPQLGRTLEEAEKLIAQLELTFPKNYKKRYPINVINSLLKQEKYDLELMINTLKIIPANEITMAELMACEDRENCISSVLTSWLNRIIQQHELAAKSAA